MSSPHVAGPAHGGVKSWENQVFLEDSALAFLAGNTGIPYISGRFRDCRPRALESGLGVASLFRPILVRMGWMRPGARAL